jgi:hypothetical protein
MQSPSSPAWPNEQQQQNNYNYEAIRKLLEDHFSREELVAFSSDKPYFKEVYTSISDGMGQQQVVSKILDFAKRRSYIPELLQWCKYKNQRAWAMYENKLCSPGAWTRGDQNRLSDINAVSPNILGAPSIPNIEDLRKDVKKLNVYSDFFFEIEIALEDFHELPGNIITLKHFESKSNWQPDEAIMIINPLAIDFCTRFSKSLDGFRVKAKESGEILSDMKFRELVKELEGCHKNAQDAKVILANKLKTILYGGPDWKKEVMDDVNRLCEELNKLGVKAKEIREHLYQGIKNMVEDLMSLLD